MTANGDVGLSAPALRLSTRETLENENMTLAERLMSSSALAQSGAEAWDVVVEEIRDWCMSDPMSRRAALVEGVRRSIETGAFARADALIAALRALEPTHPHAALLNARRLKALGQREDAEKAMIETVKLFHDHISRRLIDRDYPILDMMIQSSRTCNYACAMCGQPTWTSRTGMMSREVFDRALDQCVAEGVGTMLFAAAQGEPLLNVETETFIARAVERGIRVRLATNGSAITPARAERLAGLGLAELQFSFAGYDRETYEAIYVGGRFDRIVRNLVLMREALERRGSSTLFWVNGVVPGNDDLFAERTTAFLRSLGIVNIGLQKVNNFGGRNRGVDPTLPRAVPRLCRLPAFGVGVYADGTVTSCGCVDANGELAIGNIMKETLREMRRGPKLRTILDAFLNGSIADHPLCGDCDLRFLPLEDVDMTMLD